MHKPLKQFPLSCLLTALIALPASPLLAAEQGSQGEMQVATAQPMPAEQGNAQMTGTSTAARQGMSDDLRLALDKVSLYAETNRLDDAFALLDQLKAKYPDNPQVLVADAELKSQIGNRGAAFSELNKAIVLDPRNEDILNRQRAAVLSQGPFTSVGGRFRRTNDANEFFQSLNAGFNIDQSVSANVRLENDNISTRSPITRTYGLAKNFSGNVQRGAVTVNKMFEDGNELNGTLYAGTGIVGGGMQYSRWDYSGVTRARVNINRPDWDYIESVIERGTRDDLYLERHQFFTNRLDATLDAGFNRYGLRDISDAADSGGWDLNVNYEYPYALSGGDAIMLGGHYTVNAEYFLHTETRLGPAGNFKPLPVNGYEVHSFDASVSKNLSQQIYVEAYGGYAVNRIDGNSGPSYGGSVTYTPINHLGIEVRGFRTLLGGENNNQKEEQLALNLKWLW